MRITGIRSKNRFVVFLAAIVLLSFPSSRLTWAAAAKTPAGPKVRSFDFSAIENKSIPDLVTEISKGERRSPAGLSELGESLMSAQAKSLRDELNAVKTPEDLDDIINKENDPNVYSQLPPDAKLIADQLYLFAGCKSILYRMRPLIEGTRVSHNLVLSALRLIASSLSVYFPETQWQAGFAYLGEPMKGMGAQITTEEALHEQIISPMFDRFKEVIQRTSSLRLTNPVVWDNRVLYGKGSFGDSLSRFQWVGETERYALLSAYHLSMSNLAALNAYSLVGLFSAMDEIGTDYGFASINPFQPVTGAPASQRVATLKKYPQLFVLNSTGGQWMGYAFQHFHASVSYGVAAWQAMQSQETSGHVLDMKWISLPSLITRNGEVLTSLATKGKATSLRSDVTGDVITVKFSDFFLHPVTDLKELLPTGFETSHKTLQKSIDDQSFTYNNYFWGRATSWNTSVYQRYFPDMPSDTAQGVPMALRVLLQSPGTWAFGWVAGVAVQ